MPQPVTVESSEAQPNPITQLALLQIVSFGANALSKPYINLYLVSVGITATQVGILLSIGALAEMLIPPILSTAADRRGKHRLLFVGFIASMLLASLVFATTELFVLLAIATIVMEAAFRPSFTLGLQLVITRMENEGRNLFGFIRSYSSLGFGAASLLASWLSRVSDFAILFISAAIGYLISMGLARSLPAKTTNDVDDTLEDVIVVPRTAGFYLLAVSMFFFMMGNRAGYSFWFLHLQENLGFSNSEIGIVAAMMAFVEIPFFILLDRVLKRVDVRLAFVVGAIGMTLFWLTLGYLPSKGLVYPLLIVRGVVFAVVHLTTFLVIVRVSRAANVATNQALIQGTLPSLAALLTGSIAGWLYDHVGASYMFTAAAITSTIGIAIFIFGYNLLRTPEAERETI